MNPTEANAADVLIDQNDTTCEIFPSTSKLHTIKAFNTAKNLTKFKVELYLRLATCMERDIYVLQLQGTISPHYKNHLYDTNAPPYNGKYKECTLFNTSVVNYVSKCEFLCENQLSTDFVYIKLSKRDSEAMNNAYQICEIIMV